jgi:diaminopropionate ammonia-lyase
VEPESAACVLASVAAGRPVTVVTGMTVMAGLNCGTVSSLAWPHISHGLDACVAVADAGDVAAVRDLAGHGVDAGPCGAASLAALAPARAALHLGPSATVVLLVTEGSAAGSVTSP